MNLELPTTPNLIVTEQGQTLEYGFNDLVKYHGYQFLGGIAHAFQVMHACFPLLDNKPLERKLIRLETAFPGPGGRDAFEMVTRMVSEGRYQIDKDMAPADVIRSPLGAYFFRLHYGDKTVEATLKPGFIDPEFIQLAQKTDRNEQQNNRLEQLKIDMTKRLLSKPAREVYQTRG
jgi:hypothetical protein